MSTTLSFWTRFNEVSIEIQNSCSATRLKDNSNLYFDISWLVYEEYIAKSEQSLDQWAALVKKYPDRFMIGTDVVGHWTQYKANVEKYYALLDRLPKEVAQDLSYGNILRLCHQ